MRILVTGGAGYIGSHACLILLQSGYEVIVLDNLSNSSAESLVRVSQISGRQLAFQQGDVRDPVTLEKLFSEHAIDAVLHFAGLKSVSESVAHPLPYYDNNVHGSQVLVSEMARAGVFTLIFSSSATVYGDQVKMPVAETSPVARPINPYGRSKLIVEDMLHDLAISERRWKIAILRYFNPAGAHESGLIGESPRGRPNNLLPSIAQVAIGRLPYISVFGNDYETPDGTGVRDYIHVVDLAEGHLRAIQTLKSRVGAHVWNLGTGRGYSVIEIIRAFENVSGRSVPYRMSPRRPGDVSICFADPSKAEAELRWKAMRGVREMVRDAWNWQSINPYGYV